LSACGNAQGKPDYVHPFQFSKTYFGQVRETSMNQRYDYKYSIDNCDIVDKKKGEKYRDKRREWLEWLRGEDMHTISTQIHSMLLDYALFYTVDGLERISIEEPEEGVGFNGPIMRLFNVGLDCTPQVGQNMLG